MPWDSTPVSGEGSSSGQKQQLGCDASETKALPGPVGARAGLTLRSRLGLKQGDWAFWPPHPQSLEVSCPGRGA